MSNDKSYAVLVAAIGSSAWEAGTHFTPALRRGALALLSVRLSDVLRGWRW